MAHPISHSNRNLILTLAGGAVAVILLVMLIVGGGHQGQPSAASGPGNPMQTDQGR